MIKQLQTAPSPPPRLCWGLARPRPTPGGQPDPKPRGGSGGGSPRHLGCPPPQWDVTGNVSQVLYDSVGNPAPTGFPTTAVGQAIGGANAFFAGGQTAAHELITQVIDLDAAAEARIAAGGVNATLRGDLGGYPN